MTACSIRKSVWLCHAWATRNKEAEGTRESTDCVVHSGTRNLSEAINAAGTR